MDPPFIEANIEKVAEWVTAGGVNLTAIVAPHGHGDHWFGAQVFADRLAPAL